jgi:cyclopropane fatty-acyl-phospholipid synthase-like methyltransferase
MAEEPPRDFDAMYAAGAPPWDIGAPQPEVVHVAEEGGFRGDVLDVGCGTGENALFLARRGHPVVGVDAAPLAIERARAKLAAAGGALRATFLVHDALDLGALKHRFTTVLDCGVFHVFDDAHRKRYVESLAAALGPGGVLQLLCFSDEEPPGPGPRRVSEWQLRDAFRGPFVPTRIRPAAFESRLHPGGAKAWLATFTRA